MSLKVTILGCGSSGGVPRLALGWGACDPSDPRNRRRRCSILVERIGPDGGVTRVLVDTPPDIRDQCTDADIRWVDAVLITHEHADHTHGIDDLRGFAIASRRRVDVHCDAVTGDILRARFGYCFETPPGSDYPPILMEHRLTVGEGATIAGKGGPLAALPFRLVHGNIDALGFRFGDLAYTPDVSEIPKESEPALERLDTWIIDALRYAPHPSHFSLSDALAAIARFRPRRAILTNLHSDLDFAKLTSELPPGVEAAYDGMVVEAP